MAIHFVFKYYIGAMDVGFLYGVIFQCVKDQWKSSLDYWINGLVEDLHKAEELNSTNLLKIAKLEDQNLSNMLD